MVDYKIKNKKVKIVYCPTKELIADYNTKPLQGSLFYYYRNKVMGIRTEDFKKYKNNYIEILKQYKLYSDEDDLYIL